MTIGQAIADLRKNKNLSQAELARMLHVAPSTVGMWETDQRAVKDEQIVKIAEFFGVSSDYLLGLSKFKVVSVPKLTNNINVYGTIHAGEPAFADQNIIGQVSVTDKLIKEYGAENLFALQVKGDSMNKKILAGMIAIFAKDVEIESGDIVAVLIDDQDATIKRYKKTSMAVLFEPESYDTSFQPIVFQKSGIQDFRILGKMVYFVSGKYI